MQLFLTLIPILLVDLVNPILLGGVVLSLGSKRPYLFSGAVLLSFFLTYLLSGIIIAGGLELISEEFEAPERFDYAVELIIALLLLFFAWKESSQPLPHPEEELQQRKMNVVQSLWLGVQINIVGLPFAIPYLAGIDQILKAGLSLWAGFGFLILYNLLYILPFTLLIFTRFLMHKGVVSKLERLSERVEQLSAKWLPRLYVILALILFEDCLSYFLGYREYSLLSLT